MCTISFSQLKLEAFRLRTKQANQAVICGTHRYAHQEQLSFSSFSRFLCSAERWEGGSKVTAASQRERVWESVCRFLLPKNNNKWPVWPCMVWFESRLATWTNPHAILPTSNVDHQTDERKIVKNEKCRQEQAEHVARCRAYFCPQRDPVTSWFAQRPHWLVPWLF